MKNHYASTNNSISLQTKQTRGGEISINGAVLSVTILTMHNEVKLFTLPYRQWCINVSWLIPWIWWQRRPTISAEGGSCKTSFWISTRNRNGCSWGGDWYGFIFLFLVLLLMLVPSQKTANHDLIPRKIKAFQKFWLSNASQNWNFQRNYNWNIKAKPAQDLPLLIDQQPHHPQHDHRDLLTTHSSHQICSLFLHCHWAWMIQTRKESQIYPARITEGTDDFLQATNEMGTELGTGWQTDWQ